MTLSKPMTIGLAALLVAVLGGGVYGYFNRRPDVAAVRVQIAAAAKPACFNAARADPRNALAGDTRLIAYCDCAMDRTIAAMTDADIRAAAANAAVVTEPMRTTLAAAAEACRAEVLK